MKRFVVAVLAFMTVAIAVAPAAEAAELPGSGTLTWSLPLDLG